MKRTCDENKPPTSSIPPKKSRGPYKQWVLTGAPMPSSTKHSRKVQTLKNQHPTKTPPKSIKRILRSRSNTSEAATFTEPKNVDIFPNSQSVKASLVRSQTSNSIEAATISPAAETENVIDDSFLDEQPLPAAPLEPDILYANVSEQQLEPTESETEFHDPIVEPPTELELEVDVDGSMFTIVEEFSADEGEVDDDVHSEESFILNYTGDFEDSVEEVECDPDVDILTFESPSSPTRPDESLSSDEELIESEVSQVPLSIEEKIRLLLLLAISKRHNLSYSAAEDVLELANILANNEDCSISKHIMKSVIEKYSCALTIHHMCPSCEKYVGIISSASFKCGHCKKITNTATNKKNQNIFLYLSLAEQLKALVNSYYDKIVDPSKRQKIHESNLEDIYDGNVYAKMCTGGVTINFFVDGLQVTSTSKRSAWPILCCLNELPLSIRRKSIMMASLWLSLKKPDCNEYMKPFVAECVQLKEEGISFKKEGNLISMDVTVIIGVSDTVARPMLRNSIQFNGMYGCGFCLHPGIRMRYQKGFTRSYSTREREYPRRTHTQLMEFGTIAANRKNGIPCRGIKGISILSQLPNFNMVVCLDLDLFHALVNVSKRLANLWFLKKFSGQPFSLYSKFKEVNQRILQITPTSDVSRAPRSMQERSDLRGHEWFHWVIEYSIPVLKNLLPARYLNHWSLLVHGIALLMQNSIARSEIAYAGRYISSFVADVDVLYGKQHVTISMHLLTHLKESVNNFAQPWSHSAFVFESFLAEVKQSVKSSNGVAKQICSSIQRKIALRKLEEEVEEYLSDQQKDFLFKMKSTVHRLADATSVIGPASLLGKSTEMKLTVEHLNAVRRAGLDCGVHTTVSIYDRCLLNGEVFHSTNYSKAFRQNNSVCMLESDDVFLIEFFLVLSNSCFIIGNILERSRTKLCDLNPPHILVLKNEPEQMKRCFPVDVIQSKLLSFVLDSPCGFIRVACINVLENEMLR